MGVMTTVNLHERADRSAASGDFQAALRYSAEALRLSPLDSRARLKVALCLAAFDRVAHAMSTLRVVAEILARRGFVLSAIGACRDALGIQPASPEIRKTLEDIHERIHGLEGRSRVRVPPPSPPKSGADDEKESFLRISDPGELIRRASELGVTNPDTEIVHVEIAAVPLFSDLSRTAFISVVERMNYLKLPQGHTIVREGDAGHSLFILVQGEVKIVRQGFGEPDFALRLGAGALFGELALIRSKPRSATVITTQPAELFEIGRENVEQVAASHPTITEDLVRFARRRLIMNMMATSKVFRSFSDTQRIDVLRAFVSRIFEAGTVIISEGTEPTGLYILLEGEVEVSKVDPAGDRVVLAYLHEGEVFGEIALLGNRLTTATVTASEKSVVLYLDRARFADFTRDHPRILDYLARLSGERLEETQQAMASEGVILEADDLVIV